MYVIFFMSFDHMRELSKRGKSEHFAVDNIVPKFRFNIDLLRFTTIAMCSER